MAITVTTTTTSSNNADTLTISKPVGVSVGDTLIIVASGNQSVSPAYPFCTGFTRVVESNRNVTPYARVAVLYRIADSSDVSASNYTIDLDGTTSLGAAVMFRVQGLGSGNPVYASDSANDTQDLTSWNLSSSGLTLGRPNNQLLILAGSFNGSSNSATFGNYSVTSSDTNPTWTEVLDTSYQITGGPTEEGFYCAYAITSDTSDITAWSVTVSGSTAGAADSIAGLLAVIVEPLNATASNALFQTTPVTFPTLTGSTQEPENDFMSIVPEIFTQSASGTNPTVWENEPTSSTTWQNEEY